MSIIYRIFNTTLSSNISIPELPPVSRAKADFKFHLHPPQPQEQRIAWFHTWTLPGEKSPWLLFGRRDDSFVLRFSDGVDFLLSTDGRTIEGFPTPYISPEAVCYFLLSQVIPFALEQQGQWVIHASCVLGPHDTALVITGPSGAGKSTLASYLEHRGCSLLTDDVLLLTEHEGQICVVPSYPSVRLSGESPATTLGGIYVLALSDGAIQITPLPPRLAFLKTARQTFHLNIHDKAQLKNNFQRFARLADVQITYQLAAPRDLARLPEICDTLLRHADEV